MVLKPKRTMHHNSQSPTGGTLLSTSGLPVLADAAYRGLAGAIVHAIASSKEAQPVALQERAAQRGAAVLTRDGDRLLAIVAWAGFASEEDNGWASLSVTPACNETADWPAAVAHRMINGTGMRFLERSSPWKN